MTHHYRLNAHNISHRFNEIDRDFLHASPTQVHSWQGQDVTERPQGQTRELLNTLVEYTMPRTLLDLQHEVKPNLPWAEDHFQERVSGAPWNPPPSNSWWPFKQQGHAEHVDADGKFSHTYPERFWPKHAGYPYPDRHRTATNWGVRFKYGDLEDVVQQLKKDPSTRQAYLPVWFPEDTGAVSGQRVPCTLGYHFLIRNGQLQIAYFIRSCDYMRHFRDDVYMAVRLAAWMMDRYNEDAPREERIQLDTLYMHIVSFHIFEGDTDMLQHRVSQYTNTGGLNLGAML
jgi:thymidylate synthase